jgi:hypothetical protein
MGSALRLVRRLALMKKSNCASLICSDTKNSSCVMLSDPVSDKNNWLHRIEHI